MSMTPAWEQLSLAERRALRASLVARRNPPQLSRREQRLEKVGRKLVMPAGTIGSLGPDKAIIGYEAIVDHSGVGRPVFHDRSVRPSLQISGETGAGKGSVLKALLCHDAYVGNETYVIAPKPPEFGWLLGLPNDNGDYVNPAATIVSDGADILKVLKYACDALFWRQEQLENYVDPVTRRKGLADYRLLPPHLRWPQIVIYIDEAPGVFGDEAFLTFDGDVNLIKEVSSRAAIIAKRGRFVGVTLVIVTQYPTLDGTFGNNRLGPGIRANCSARVHLDRNTQSLYSVFDSCSQIPPKVLQLMEDNVPGRGGFVFLDDERLGVPASLQAVWIDPDDALNYALGYQGPPAWSLWKMFREQKIAAREQERIERRLAAEIDQIEQEMEPE